LICVSVGETSLDDALMLAVKVLSKTMDTTSPSADKVEIATVTRVNGEVKYKVMDKNELEALLKKAEVILKAEAAKEAAADI
jgi:20S proteasome subunit alpha 3